MEFLLLLVADNTKRQKANRRRMALFTALVRQPRWGQVGCYGVRSIYSPSARSVFYSSRIVGDSCILSSMDSRMIHGQTSPGKIARTSSELNQLRNVIPPQQLLNRGIVIRKNERNLATSSSNANGNITNRIVEPSFSLDLTGETKKKSKGPTSMTAVLCALGGFDFSLEMRVVITHKKGQKRGCNIRKTWWFLHDRVCFSSCRG